MRYLAALTLLIGLLGTPVAAQEIDHGFITGTGEQAPLVLQKKLEIVLTEKQPKATLVLLVNCVTDRCTDSVRAAHEFIATTLRDEPFLFVVVAAGGTEEDVKRLRDAVGSAADFPIIADKDSAIFSAFAKEGVPRAVLFDKDGKIVYQHAGWKPGREVEWRVMTDAVLAGRELPSTGGAGGFAAAGDIPEDFSEELYARDIRGQQAPEVPVEEWITAPPAHDGKFLLVDFWATWCGPCISSLQVAEKEHHKFSDRLVTWAVSDEPPDLIRTFVRQSAFTQPIGVDTQARAKQALFVQGIPHAFIRNPQGLVVWQGHPMELWSGNSALLKKILDGHVVKPADPKE